MTTRDTVGMFFQEENVESLSLGPLRERTTSSLSISKTLAHDSERSCVECGPPNERQRYRVTIAHPRSLAKGYSSLFVVQIYLPSFYSQALETIRKEFDAHKVAEHTWDVELEKRSSIRIELSSPALSFSSPVIKKMENDLIVARFAAIPHDNISPGTHYVILSIFDGNTQIECESISFAVHIADYAFDHISIPMLSAATSVFLGLTSIATFIVTGLEYIDKATGAGIGLAAAMFGSTIFVRRRSVFEQAKVSHTHE